MLLGACILGISGLIDLVMGRSEWHAGMERSARVHVHALSYLRKRLSRTNTRLDTFAGKDEEKRKKERNGRRLLQVSRYFIANRADWSQPRSSVFTRTHTHTRARTQRTTNKPSHIQYTHWRTNNLILLPNSRKVYISCAEGNIGHLITAV